MRKLIAYCGLDCEKCDARIATLNNDNALREKTAKLWSKLNGVTITADMINCMGCHVDGVKTLFCSEMCKVRKCAVEKGIETCGECPDMELCQIVGAVLSNNSEALENLKKQNT